ncbi:E3 ubiquitin-protein ligase SH3RF2-like isoform X2 [Daktulosphaira vitifoliae]|uniref:E3 ubiquitin-protein ligase SH3RF2-like isoform X2 n=1 Tax=Daktulosphaira vitifoliae TaxID=58002 RepID=UPI0021A99698|nr:E3 ubiquitin-protein ligase SH3RF2-like isoform X2 [Daktulosphaira vitifoliae]
MIYLKCKKMEIDENLLDKLLECRHCLDYLDTNNKMLPCQHTFCKKCLDIVVETFNELRCPVCYIVFDNEVDELLPNIFIMQILNDDNCAHVYSNKFTTNKKKNLENISKTELKTSAKVIYNYASKEPGHLELSIGDYVTLFQKVNINWYLGEKEGNVGLIPQPCIQPFNVKIERNNMFINDEDINQYLELISHHSSDDILILNTSFYKTLKYEGYKKASNWTKDVDIFSKEKLLIPVFVEVENHWCLIVVNFSKKTIEYYDSLKIQYFICLKKILKYLMREHIIKKGKDLKAGNWSLHISRKCPQQNNPWDGGFYVCKFVECLSKNQPIKFEHLNMSKYKKQLLYEIKHKKLLK